MTISTGNGGVAGPVRYLGRSFPGAMLEMGSRETLSSIDTFAFSSDN